MIISLPMLPPSTNHAFIQRGRFRVLSPEARAFKAEVEVIVRALNETAPEGLLSVHLRFSSPRWLCKNGSPRKADVSNREKLAIDAVFAALGVDDSMIWSLTLEKVVADQEGTEIMLEKLAGQ